MAIKSINARAARVSYPALVLKQNRHRFFFLTVPIDVLFGSCVVSRRLENPVEGFQRALDESRANSISEYLFKGVGSIPSNVVLSAQESAGLKYNPRTKSVSFGRAKSAFLVLDGQHRLWGYEKCASRHRVPVAIYDGLTRDEEARIFIDINTTQRGVPAALLLDIKQLAQMESGVDAKLRQFFDRLNSDGASPMVGRLSAAKSVKGKISRVTFNQALRQVLSCPVMVGTNEDNQYRLILHYLNAFDAELSDKKLLIRSAFFEAIFTIFDAVVQNAVTKFQDARQPSIQKIIKPLAQLDFRIPKNGPLPNRREITELLQSAMRLSRPISSEML